MFVTAERTPIVSILLRPAENALHWGFSKMDEWGIRLEISAIQPQGKLRFKMRLQLSTDYMLNPVQQQEPFCNTSDCCKTAARACDLKSGLSDFVRLLSSQSKALFSPQHLAQGAPCCLLDSGV